MANETVLRSNFDAFPWPLVPGPIWTSFENFRRGGGGALDEIPPHGVGTLRAKTGTFYIVQDEDFRWFGDLVKEVNRLEKALEFVIEAAKLARAHPDEDHLKFVVASATFAAGIKFTEADD